MRLVKKIRNIEKNDYKNIVEGFLDFISEGEVSKLPFPEKSEILRLSICYAFGLETKEKISGLEDYAKNFEQNIMRICEETGALKKDLDYKKGLLEACIHSFEMSRAKVGV